MPVVNIAGYQFVRIEDPHRLREPLRSQCVELGLKGTVLLAPEGINLFLAGSPDQIEAILAFLRRAPVFQGAFSNLAVKKSVSALQPFRRMLVRIKKEIITMRHPALQPEAGRAPAVPPATLKEWLDTGVDDQGRPIILLDTRNTFEVELGTFEGAHHLSLAHFGTFPEAFQEAIRLGALDLAGKHVVTFCTGGIRCEKAALYMAESGVETVTQLDGGILKYFEDVGSAHWRGECFVFDDRVALDPALRETSTVQCYACRSVVNAQEQLDPRYVEGVSCPHCARSDGAAVPSAPTLQSR